MEYRVLKPFGSRNGLTIYKIGEIVSFPKGSNRLTRFLHAGYVEPLQYDNKLPENVRNMLQSWIDCNENPIKEIGILDHTYYETGAIDSDGFYCYSFWGYVNPYCDNRVAGQITLRLKAPLSFKFERHKDYSLKELGLREKK